MAHLFSSVAHFEVCFVVFFGPKLRKFGREFPNWWPPWTVTGELGVQTLDVGRPSVHDKHDWSGAELPRGSMAQNSKEKCLLAYCLLLLARYLGRGV